MVTKFIKIGIETFASKRGANKYFYHNDHLGSVNVITNFSGTRAQLNEYDPWGGVSRSEGNIDPTHRFNGKELDAESGLYYYGGRYYDSEVSRFISGDPFVPGPGNPQSLNRYSYTINNPQNHLDPSGHSFWKIFKKIFSWHHKIFMAVNQLHLDPVGFGVTMFANPRVAAIYNAGNNIAGGIVSMFLEIMSAAP